MADGTVGAASGETRRDFLELVTVSTVAVGAAAVAWPFIAQMNPSADVLALASTEVDLSPIQPGMAISVMWRGKPVFIRNRTPEEIAAAEQVDLAALRDPQPDDVRIREGRKEWLVVLGVCTHLGCVPLGNKPTEARGDFGGWFCPCHGSHYDTSGRIRLGPAPANLPVPDYTYLSESSIRIG